ncbi:MAG: aldehyde dehydrogenase family protein [Fibrobacterota bacterium]
MEKILKTVQRQKSSFDTGITRTETYRRDVLKKLKDLIESEEKPLLEALHADLGRPEMESWTAEIAFLRMEIQKVLKKLHSWMKPQKRGTSPLMFPGRVETEQIPHGTVLIIAPFNYPLQLLLSPLIGALAAGNTALIKPSERAPHTARLLNRIIPRYFLPGEVACIDAPVEDLRGLIQHHVDMVCFTGSVATGRAVMRDAAVRAIPVLLELGGANPAYVAESANLRQAARRIVWGKFFNAGQTCVAPNHCYVAQAVAEEFEAELIRAVEEMYGSTPEESKNYSRIIDTPHFESLLPWLSAGEILTGGDHDREQNYIAPTVIRCAADQESPDLQEEIFGPVLPVIAVESIDQAVEEQPRVTHPLAVYGFGDRALAQRLRSRTMAGSLVMNGTLHRMADPMLPFGGAGQSGIGRYHGKEGFTTFSTTRTVVRKHPSLELPGLYPPYGSLVSKMIKMFTKIL